MVKAFKVHTQVRDFASDKPIKQSKTNGNFTKETACYGNKVLITLCCVSCVLILSGSLAISTSESRFFSDSSNHSMSLFQDSWNWRVTRNKHSEKLFRTEWEPMRAQEKKKKKSVIMWQRDNTFSFWPVLSPQEQQIVKKTHSRTCLALFLASSSCRPRSTDRCTSFSQRPCTLSSRFLISTTSCFWLKYFRCVPVLSSSMMWSLWEFTSVTNTWGRMSDEERNKSGVTTMRVRRVKSYERLTQRMFFNKYIIMTH